MSIVCDIASQHPSPSGDGRKWVEETSDGGDPCHCIGGRPQYLDVPGSREHCLTRSDIHMPKGQVSQIWAFLRRKGDIQRSHSRLQPSAAQPPSPRFARIAHSGLIWIPCSASSHFAVLFMNASIHPKYQMRNQILNPGPKLKSLSEQMSEHQVFFFFLPVRTSSPCLTPQVGPWWWAGLQKGWSTPASCSALGWRLPSCLSRTFSLGLTGGWLRS